jgi:hypothetical protein
VRKEGEGGGRRLSEEGEGKGRRQYLRLSEEGEDGVRKERVGREGGKERAKGKDGVWGRR